MSGLTEYLFNSTMMGLAVRRGVADIGSPGGTTPILGRSVSSWTPSGVSSGKHFSVQG